ncbi:iron ABC transporter ATP-binding protein [Acinetobacter radioresistens]|uniref:iron ABC transporter ATP-binding protein n=1 Tax=Acinetobacter radioresistens TaxID=40216 RepID=UPI000C32486D|nr:ATP-binding cassette domain-containing protein [Acinetobacter radioresistens]MCM1935431.1 ATP-binding cassette domain-containing protein [Acinetobacter radioresistens]MCM1953326.1 ATP-binding cassette domain-containing protein [Acinetobacter radioresistens]MCU4308987.1 ATP-binding cassette domain-containing protein [Acinetobacter radioresistens]MCU4567035.1 ATP-binding cassette domain-containing protein [Acinetobacter radioresistens]PKH27806.1 iron ABC transporter ATP-binding protein [Acine
MAIELKNLSKSYHGQKVVNDVSLTIAKGQFTAFIGPNGAGKSTLLSMISRLTQVDTGDVLLDSQNIQQMKSTEIAKKLAILKQSNHTELRLSIEDLVAFGRFPYSQGRLKAEDQKIIDQAIAYMELEPLRHKQLSELSGGQRQRAYISMVLAQDTDYILLDEPLNNLDMKHSAQIMRVLKDLAVNHGKSIIVVIHDINFASVYADQIIAMKDGQLLYQGTPEQIMQENVLQHIFDFAISIQQVQQHKLGLYFIS